MILKNIFDYILALILLIFLVGLIVLLVIVSSLDTNQFGVFVQNRIGRNGKTFKMYKIRSMKGFSQSSITTSEHQITKFGKFLRNYKLDELPQLFNILKGEMSIVGPRPALWNQFDLIELRDIYGANDVPVGLTGWAQINGRDEIDISVKANLDGYYAKNICFKLDAKCFFKTVVKVLKRDGIKEGIK